MDVPKRERLLGFRGKQDPDVGIKNRPTESITAKLNQWQKMSATRKARQIAKASADVAVTALNAVAIVIGAQFSKAL